jgi:hypothetical protein
VKLGNSGGKTKFERELIILKVSMKKGKASKPMYRYLCSPRFLGLALKATRRWERGKSHH